MANIGEIRGTLDTAYNRIHALEEDPENQKAKKSLERAAHVLATSLNSLEAPERDKLTDDDKIKLRAVAGAVPDAFQKYDGALERVLGKDDPHFLATFAKTQGARNSDAAMGAGATMGLQAVHSEMMAAGGAPTELTPKQLEAPKSNPTLAVAYAATNHFAEPGRLDGTLAEFNESLGKQTRALRGEKDPVERKALQASIARTQQDIKWMEGIKTTLGIDAAGVADDPLTFQILAHGIKDKNGKPLPSTLSTAQKSKLDEMAAAGKIDLSKLALPTGPGANPANALAADLAAGKRGPEFEAKVKELVAAESPENPAQKASTEANLEKLRKINPEAYQTIRSLRDAKLQDEMNSSQSYNEIMGLVNSGMPIEVVIMLVMLKLAERQEDKFKMKLKELSTFEKLEQVNKKAAGEFEKGIADAQAAASVEASEEVKQGKPANYKLTAEDNETISQAVQQKVTKAETVLQAELAEKQVNPTDYGLKGKSTTIVMQEMQAEQQIFMQVMQALAAVMRQIQDLVMTPIRNIR